MSYFLTPQAMSGYGGLGATWDPYCVGTCEKECAAACDPASARYDAGRCASCKNLYSDYKKKLAIGAAAALIAPRGGAPAYAPPPSGMPSWLLPVGLGAGVLVLFLVMRK